MNVCTCFRQATALLLFSAAAATGSDAIRPYPENPFYWQYKGKPVLLLGGSWQDNLFNHPVGLTEHLDLLRSVGGNYVRNTMSHRDGANVFAFQQIDGKFDLDRWNDEYWERFDRFLKLTAERDIIVQIEVWETWDHYTDRSPNVGPNGGWSKHPFNPANNVTYTPEQSRLPTRIDYQPGHDPTEHRFFRTVPALDNNRLVLGYQQALVDKMLSYTLNYPHVLSCMNNETGERMEWGDYWADYIREKGRAAGREVHTADMRRNYDLRQADQAHLYDQPERFSFLDVSQNSTQSGQTHWDRLQYVRTRIKDRPRPINTVKIYNIRGGDDESVRRFCRLVFGGGAGARFHRPHPLVGEAAHAASSKWGLGLSPLAQATIRSMRMLDEAMNIYRTEPALDLLHDRDDNEAYLLVERGKQYAVYFTDGGAVRLDMSAATGPFSLRWLDVLNSRWASEAEVRGGESRLPLDAPGQGPWVALILPAAKE